MKKAIVTGANGFVGTALVKELAKNDVEVTAVVRNEQSDISGISNLHNVKIVFCTLDKIESLAEKMHTDDYDVFYHLAWEGSSGVARADAVLQLKNVQWSVNCVQVAKKIGCKRFVNAGSIMEKETILATNLYGVKPSPSYIYGTAKLSAHCMCKTVAANIGIDFISAIITNIYGEGEVSPRFINTTIRKIINDEQLQFTAATQNYDFIYITDAAIAFYLIGKNGKPFADYVIGSSHAQPLKQFIIEIKKTIAQDKDFVFGDIPFIGANLPLSEFNCNITERDVGFKSNIDFCTGIRKTKKWILENT